MYKCKIKFLELKLQLIFHDMVKHETTISYSSHIKCIKKCNDILKTGGLTTAKVVQRPQKDLQWPQCTTALIHNGLLKLNNGIRTSYNYKSNIYFDRSKQ